MSLDTRTLVYVNVVVAIALGFAMILVWRTRKTYPGFELWAFGNFEIAMGYFLFGMRGQISDFFSVVVANLLISAYYILIYEGLRRFLAHGSPWVSRICSIFLLIFFLFFTYANNNISARVIVVSLFFAVMSAFTAYMLFKGTPRHLRLVYWLNGGFFFFNSIFMTLRAVFTYFQPGVTEFFEPNLLLSMITLLSIPATVIWTFGMMILNGERLEQELKALHQELQIAAVSDSLTGTYNHRYFFEMGKKEVQQARRYNHPMTVIALDVDYFKEINDTFGHSQGNDVLIGIVSACRNYLREADIFGRLGGDEFGVLLPNTDLAEGQVVAERLRKIIEATSFTIGKQSLHITASIGLSMISLEEEGVEPALQRADTALYTAKRGGRNAVVALPLDSI